MQKRNFDIVIDKQGYDRIYSALDTYVSRNGDSIEYTYPSHRVENVEEAELFDMEVKRTRDIEEIDDVKLRFIVLVSAEINVSETYRRDRISDEITQWFAVKCSAAFDDSLHDIEVLQIEVYES